MEQCDFTGDSDFDFFIPNSRFSEHSLQSNDSYTHFFYNRSNQEEQNTPRPTDEQKCFPRERCAGMETSLSEQFPPQYPQVRKPNPFDFLNEGEKSAKRAIRRNTTAVIKPNECCNHDEPIGPRKFLVQFDKSNATAAADISDHCYAAERDRCEEFWTFVNCTPELEKIIKDGHFFHKTPPKSVPPPPPVHHKCGHAETTPKLAAADVFKPQKSVKKKPKYAPEMEALRQRNIILHEESRLRRAKLRRRIDSLQEKSGQKSTPPPKPLVTTGTPSPRTAPTCDLAACLNPSPDEVYDEMELFDEISGNPVSVSCQFKKRNREYCDQLIMPLGVDLDAGESSYFGEAEE